MNNMNIKTSLSDYEIEPDTRPIKITISESDKDIEDAEKAIEQFKKETREREDYFKELTLKGMKIKEEEDLKLKDKLIELESIPITTKTPEEMERRDFILKVRTIALSKLKLNPIMHTTDLSDKQHKDFIKKCDKILKKMSPDEITSRFNEIVIDDLFNSKSDYTKYAIYTI